MQMESMVTPTMVEQAHAAVATATTAMDPMMQVTHYMQLLMTNQPWNLLFFMAIPVILAETLTATEFFVAFRRDHPGTLRTVNRYIGISLGVYFTLIAGYLIATVIPTIVWRGPIDIISVGFYVAGFLPLLAIALLELGIIDEIVKEPLGGAHSDPAATAQAIKEAVIRHLEDLKKLSSKKLIAGRFQKYAKIGQFNNTK